jgi:acetoin utilization protein AcuB
MTRKVFVVPPDILLSAAWDLMCRERFRHLPVVSGGSLVGILSDRDILVRADMEAGTISVLNMRAGEAATPWSHVCTPDTDVRDVVRLMTERKIDALPFVFDLEHYSGINVA